MRDELYGAERLALRSWAAVGVNPDHFAISFERVVVVSSAAPTGRVPGLRGAFIIASTPYSCVGFGDQHRGIVVLLK